ncbi:MFS transporter [Microbacteriaceae bacterium 4G12]
MNSTTKKYLSMLIICLGGGIIFVLPYIQYSFYEPLQKATSLNDVQMGNLMSVLGIMSSFAYLLGGILADRFNVRYLISISLAVTGLAGLWFSTLPSYGILLVIMGIYAISTVLTYWPAMIKAVKLLGSGDEQGKMFGFREAGFGLFSLIFTQIGTLLIYNKSQDITGVKNIIVFYSIIYFVTAILTFLFLPNSKREDTKKIDSKEFVSGIKYVLKQPGVWLCGLIIFCVYTVAGPGLGKFVPYLTEVLGVKPGTAASISSFRLYLLPLIAAPIAGFFVDKFKSSTRILFVALIALAISTTIFVMIPANANSATLIIIMGFVASFVVYMLRGVYFVPLSELRIPNAFFGTAAGLISFIGFLPDAFMFTVFGNIMQDHPGVSGYRNIFWICIGLAILGAVFVLILQKIINKMKNTIKA